MGNDGGQQRGVIVIDLGSDSDDNFEETQKKSVSEKQIQNKPNIPYLEEALEIIPVKNENNKSRTRKQEKIPDVRKWN